MSREAFMVVGGVVLGLIAVAFVLLVVEPPRDPESGNEVWWGNHVNDSGRGDQ